MSSLTQAAATLHKTRATLLKKRKTLHQKKQRIEEREKIFIQELEFMKEMREKMKQKISGETLEQLLSRQLGDIARKQKQLEKIKHDYKLLIIDINSNNEEQKHIEDEMSVIDNFEVEFMDIP